MEDKKIFFTWHAIERFKQRFSKECKNIRSDDFTDSEVRRKMYDLVYESKPDRSFLNNSIYMIKLYEKYGYDLDFAFLRHENIIFVVKKERGNKIVVMTCYQADNKIFARRVSFKKKDEPQLVQYEEVPF